MRIENLRRYVIDIHVRKKTTLTVDFKSDM